MSLQRRRGEQATFFPTVTVKDGRGNRRKLPDRSKPTRVRVWEVAERSSKAEVPGDVSIDIIRVGAPVMDGVDLWGVAWYRRDWWDIAAPPSLRNGSHHVTHMSIVLRRRPDDDGGELLA